MNPSHPPSIPPLTRRNFFHTAALGAAAAAATPALLRGRDIPAAASVAKARNLIFLCSDGMNHGTLAFADQYLRMTEDRSSHWMGLYETDRSVVRALMETRSADRLVPDSAAAGSAWGCGERVNNGSLNITPDGREPAALLVKAKARGKKTGLVTTTTATHATPASFAANLSTRNDEESIAVQYLERGIDVIMGGGRPFFLQRTRGDGRDLIAEFEAKGFRVARTAPELKAIAADHSRVLGLFADGHLPYSIDHRSDSELRATVPTLAEMTAAALLCLAKAREGFVLQIEGGRVDHAGHANDAPAILHDQLAFDAAVGVVLAFARERGDTLVIVTTDHGTGGAMVNGLGSGYSATEPGLLRAAEVRHSYEFYLPRLLAATPGERLSLLRNYTGCEITEEELAALGFVPDGPLPNRWSLNRAMGALLERYFAVGWTTGHHTGEGVEFAAVGPGAGAFPAYVRNDAVHHHLTEILGL